LATGRSHFNKLHEILILVDRILIQQLQESRKLSDQWEASIPSLSLRDGMGFAGVAVSGLLSGKGWRLLGRSFEASLYMSVSPTEATDDFATRAFRVIDGRFPKSKAHTVHVGPLDKYGRGAESICHHQVGPLKRYEPWRQCLLRMWVCRGSRDGRASAV